MDNNDRKINFFVKLLEYSGTIIVIGLIAAWFFSINSFNAYFDNFLIDASQLVSNGIIWQFASQKLLRLMNLSIFIMLVAVCLIIILRNWRKSWIPPNQTPLPKIRIKSKPNTIINVLLTLLSTCIALLLIIILLLLLGEVGRLRAKIDQERFNNNKIIPQKIAIDKANNIIDCVSLLGSFDKYTFVIYQDRKTELIKSDRILSIQPMFKLPKPQEKSIPISKGLDTGKCSKKEAEFLIRDSVAWTLIKFVLAPKGS